MSLQNCPINNSLGASPNSEIHKWHHIDRHCASSRFSPTFEHAECSADVNIHVSSKQITDTINQIYLFTLPIRQSSKLDRKCNTNLCFSSYGWPARWAFAFSGSPPLALYCYYVLFVCLLWWNKPSLSSLHAGAHIANSRLAVCVFCLVILVLCIWISIIWLKWRLKRKK